MKINAEHDCYTLESSGRDFFANLGILGMSPELEISDGYDGNASILEHRGWWDTHDSPPEFNDPEKREIALEMIRRWSLWGGIE
jgi:hypothetical protein